MIDRSEILAIATDLSLSADVVEKDYVLGWLLAAIHANGKLGAAWIFKGGTCLKKCYFESYRFSEDLGFTLTDESHLEPTFLRSAFADVAAWVYEETGIEMPANQMRFEVYRNNRGGLSGEGRIYYNGPLRHGGSLPRIKLDLTVDELLVLPPVERCVDHPYTDAPEGGIFARCYAYEEGSKQREKAVLRHAAHDSWHRGLCPDAPIFRCSRSPDPPISPSPPRLFPSALLRLRVRPVASLIRAVRSAAKKDQFALDRRFRQG